MAAIRSMSRSIRRNWLRHLCKNDLSVSAAVSSRFNQPISSFDVPSSGGIATMMRVPYQETTKGLDACFVGVPLDIGTSNKPGARLGARQIRTESVLISVYNKATGALPFESLQIADVGDVFCTPYHLPDACKQITEAYQTLIKDGCKTLTLGGDHTITYPILKAIAEKYGAVGMVHVDAHADCDDTLAGYKVNHGTPFRRAQENGLIQGDKVVQIGLRGSVVDKDDGAWELSKGFVKYTAEDCYHKSLTPLMQKVRDQMGDRPVYLTFDIDALDPCFAPGTGTPEIGGLTSIQALEIIRGCRGLNIIGCDLVEVSPPYDPYGTTAHLAANLLFEMLCVLPGVKYHPPHK